MKKIKTEILFKLSNLNSNLALTLGYLNPALNNLVQKGKKKPTATSLFNPWESNIFSAPEI